MKARAAGMLICACAAGIFAGDSLAQVREPALRYNLAVFQPGERLQYKVKWLFFRIGTIVVETDSVPDAPGRVKTTISLDSNPDIFFISIHNHYVAIVNSNPVRCEQLRSTERQGNDTLITTYEFVDSLEQILMEQRIFPADTVVKAEILDSVDRFFDGTSLFFLARTLLQSGSRYTVPTLVDFDLFTTDITFTDRVVPRSIGSVEWDIETRELYGQANFEGKSFAGFSGEFKGWFSNDDAAVPLQAEMNITLGSIDIELEQWSRPGWQPPKARKKP